MKPKKIDLCVKSSAGDVHKSYEVRKLINAGYTARDSKLIELHMEEMKKSGISIPRVIPVFFPKLTERITTENRIEVLAENTSSGEIEFVLLFDESDLYIGVGSDHTDRVTEKASVVASKQLYPNVISSQVWLYDEVRDHWDDLIMRSWIKVNGERKLYQEAKVSQIMSVDELVEKVQKLISTKLAGTVLYAGTVPCIDGEMRFSRYFEASLTDEQMKRTITCTYFVEAINWFKEAIELSI